MDKAQPGRPLAVDEKDISANPDKPWFIAPPAGAPVYYRFVVLEDVIVDGFTLGKITDFEVEVCDVGDAFIIAPDGARAGLVWEVCSEAYFEQVCAPEAGRWGYGVSRCRFP